MAALQQNRIKSYSVHKYMDIIDLIDFMYVINFLDIPENTSRVDFVICTMIMRSY